MAAGVLETAKPAAHFGATGRIGTRVFRDAAVIVVGVIVAARAVGLGFGDGVDFHAYWSVSLDSLYANSRSYAPNAFLYTPLFAQVTEPLRWLPFNLALALWTALELGCLLWLAGPWTLPLMLPLAPEWMNGNVHLVMAAAVVLGMRQSAGWAVPAFTKLGPALGLGWFVLRGEWRYVARTLALLGVLALASFVIAPGLWAGWVAMLTANAGAMPPPGSMQLPLVVRVGIGIGIVAWGARTNRRWTVPIACAFGLPVLWWAGLIAFGVAALYLRDPQERGHERTRAARTAGDDARARRDDGLHAVGV